MREQIRSMDLHCVGEKHAIRYLLIEYYQDYLYLPFNYHKLTNIILIYVKTSNLIKKIKILPFARNRLLFVISVVDTYFDTAGNKSIKSVSISFCEKRELMFIN